MTAVLEPVATNAAVPSAAAGARILLLAPSGGLGGGIERYLATVQECLAGAGAEVVRCDLIRARSPLTLGTRVSFVGRSLHAALRRGPYDCVLSGHPDVAPVGLAAAALAGVRSAPVFFYCTDIWGMGWSTRVLLKGRTRLVPLTISSYSAGALSAYGVAGILPPSVTPAWRDALREVAALRPPPAATPNVITVFRLPDWRDKGLPELFGALRRFRAESGPVRLTVAGHGPAPAELREAVGAEPGTMLVEDPDDRTLAGLYGAADLFALCTRTRPGRPTYGEGYGIVLLEAQLAGCAVVGPASGGSWDAYQDGSTGWTPVDESVDALTEVLRPALADRAALAAAGARAAAWAVGVTDPVAYADRVVRAVLAPRS